MMNADKVRPVLCRILEFLRKARSCVDDAGQAGGGRRTRRGLGIGMERGAQSWGTLRGEEKTKASENYGEGERAAKNGG